MRMTLTSIGTAAPARDPAGALVQMYLERCAPFAQSSAEVFRTEKSWAEWLARQSGRTPVFPVLLDSRGRTMSSEAFAAWVGARRDEGAQHLVFAIGPPSGWSEEARARARLLLSFGPMTLPHALARLVLAEQLYRALTILSGHPYHSGH